MVTNPLASKAALTSDGELATVGREQGEHVDGAVGCTEQIGVAKRRRRDKFQDTNPTVYLSNPTVTRYRCHATRFRGGAISCHKSEIETTRPHARTSQHKHTCTAPATPLTHAVASVARTRLTAPPW